VPFRGSYLYCSPELKLYTHIYPVPDMDLPFLGVHTTLTVDGMTKIGPTATPIWSREQYTGYWNTSKLEELASILLIQNRLFWTNRSFRNLSFVEIPKLLQMRGHLIAGAHRLVQGLKSEDFEGFGPAGIRAQLVDLKNDKLEMDFVVEGDQKSTHVLNAVSPAWTCCIPLAEHVVSSSSPVSGNKDFR
jgi:L-2-hydroxyglutarate oxidase